MNTPDLFDICTSHHGGNIFSIAANHQTNKRRDTARIIDHLRTVPNSTCDEAEIALAMNHQTCSARFSELKRDGLITPAGRRKTRTGSSAQVWRLRV